MKVNWLVVTKKEADLDIAEVTLLSAEEYEAAKDVIPMRDEFWWLRSPCSEGSNRAGFVDDRGRLDFDGVDNEYVGVRPALRIRKLRSSNLSRGDKFELARHVWTIVSDSLALCDDIVGYTRFRKDWKDEEANDYESSDIRAWLECWAVGEGIFIRPELSVV